LGDALFGEHDDYAMTSNGWGLIGAEIPSPEEMLKKVCKSVCKFYSEVLHPIFSRHMHGLAPNPNLLDPGGAEDDMVLYHRQMMVSNKIVSVESLQNILHLLERATNGDIDTYVECVGAHAVFWLWQRLLETAPIVIERLMDNFMNSLTLIEYKNVQAGMSPDPSKPAISEAMAEKYYVMCNALELKSEPKNEREVMELKLGPLRSPPNAVDPLSKIGAFRRIEIEFTGP
jgi:hypothetical protein